MLDTGSDGTAIDQEVAEVLGLGHGKTQAATSVAGNLEVTKTDPIDFTLGKSSLTADEANILPLDTHIKGLNFILGFDALKKTPFTIDYLRSVLRFGSLPEGIRVQFAHGKDIRPTAELKVAGVTIAAMLDTGSAAGIMFPVAWVRENLANLALGAPQKRTILGSQYESQKFILKEVLLGGASLFEVGAQAVATEEGSFGDLATVGNPILEKFKQIGIDGERRVISFANG
jgi:hypothetical protein